MPFSDQPLAGGRATAGVVRVGDTVRRPIHGDTSFSHACLRHLEQAGFAGAPRCLGFDEEGREVLSFLPGRVPAELGSYADGQLEAAALLLRRFHDATQTMHVVRARGLEVACHNDWAPTNTVFRDGLPVGMIDFDTAAPGLRLWDLGYSAFTWLDLGNEDHAADEQVRRLSLFAEAYGKPGCTAPQIAVFALARQTALAASAQARGLPAIAGWASACARWTALHVVERLLPSGYPAPGLEPVPRVSKPTVVD